MTISTWATPITKYALSNEEWPRANLFRLLSADNSHVFLGRYFDGGSSNQGSWMERYGYATLIHEFGHYGLGLGDSYYYYDLAVWKRDGSCTSPAIRENHSLDINASLMYDPYNASEFAMQNVAGLWSNECKDTDQWQINGNSDWETILHNYEDDFPARWQIKTPSAYGGVVIGPYFFEPINNWSVSTVGSDANTGACDPSPQIEVRDMLGVPAKDAEVVLRKGNRTIPQGRLDESGMITVLGASSGDRVVVQEWGIDLHTNSVVVNCSAVAQPQTASPRVEKITLEPAAFNLEITTESGSAANQVQVIVKASAALSGPPETYLTQVGAASALPVTLIYDSTRQAYSGSITLNAGLTPSGSIIARATSTSGQAVEIAAGFAFGQVTPNQNAIVWSGDGQAELYLPAGSVSSAGRINIISEQPTGALPPNHIMLSGPYTVQGEAGLTLAKNGNLTLYYEDHNGTLDRVSANSAQIYRWDGTTWTPFPSTASKIEQVISAAVNGFGTYALMAETQRRLYLPSIAR